MRRKREIDIKQWTASNGNVCFSLMHQRRYDRLLIIMLAALLAILTYTVLCFIFEKLILHIPIAILAITFFLWLIRRIAGGDEAIIAKTVLQIMDDSVEEDVKAVGAKVDKRLVVHDTKGTYGIVEASCLLVLLDNGVVWEYPLVCHRTEDGDEYFECERIYVISDNQKHISKINPNKRGYFKLTEKTRLGLVLTAMLIVGALVFAGGILFFVHFKWQYLLVLFGYIGVYFLMKWLESKIADRAQNIVKHIREIQFFAVYLLVQSITPAITIVGTYLFVAVVAFGVPAAILIGLSLLGLLTLKVETVIFIVVAIGSILCSHSYKITKKIIHSTPLRDWGNHTYESYREQLAIYLIHPSNVIFLLYLIYFLFLVISGYLQIEKGGYLITQGVDAAILKAFLVFIAFTNMRVKARDAKLNVRELYQRTMKLFVHDE